MNRFAAALLILLTTLGVSRWTERRRPDSLARPLASIPARMGQWSLEGEATLEPEVLRVLKPTSYLSRSYASAHSALTLFIAYYAEQRSGESMHSPRNCLPGSGWEMWAYGSATVNTAAGPVAVNRYSVQNGTNRLVVLYWYQSRKRIVASEYAGKLFLVRDALMDGVTSGSIVRITVPDRPGGVESGLDFASLVIPEVRRCLGLQG